MFLGILIIIIAIGAYLAFENTIREHSELMGYDILIAKTNISKDTIIRTAAEAERLFTVRRIPQNEVVPSAIKVEGTTEAEGNIVSIIRNFFLPPERTITAEYLQKLTNRKITENIFENQQILSIYLSKDVTEFEEGERLFAVPVTFLTSVGGKIQKNDYVDIWVQYKDDTSRRVVGPLSIIQIKDANNREIEGDSVSIPAVVIFKLNQEQIMIVSQKMNMGTIFLTKWGTTPQIPAQLEAFPSLPAEITE